MQNTSITKDFLRTFSQLNEENQRCVLAILQALTYAQTIEREDIQDKHGREWKELVP